MSFNQDRSHVFLSLENITKHYSEGDRIRDVLRNVTIEICQGELVSILGKSGSGKTTLLNLISGIDLPDAGIIRMNGTDLTAMDDRRRTLFRRQNIGFVFQFFNLISTLTVWENITLPLELNQRLDQHGKQKAKELLELVGLDGRARAYPDRLSGGEQQRVAIARALVHDPALLLADEPTGNLDEETGKQVMALLDRLTRQAGKNLILVTHNPDAAESSDRVFYLREGKLLGKPA